MAINIPTTAADGTTTLLENLAALHILTTNNVVTYDAKSLVKYKEFEDQFYDPSSIVPNPQSCLSQSGGQFLLNDSKIYYIHSGNSGVGKYGEAKVSRYPQAALHPDVFINQTSNGIAFDTINRSFVGFSASGFFLEPFVEKSGEMSTQKMNYRLVSLLRVREDVEFLVNTASGFAVMQGVMPSDKRYYLLSLTLATNGTATYPFTSPMELIPDNCKMPTASLRTASRDGKVIYFATGNELSAYTHATGLVEREKLLKTFPADEQIAWIGNLRRAMSGATSVGSDLNVLTNSPQGWKLYTYPVLSPGEIEAQPYVQYSGQGTARFGLWRVY